MTTSKQVKANQENAKKSTGPKSKAGKEAVSQNAIKHGVFSKRALIKDESPEEFAQLLDDLSQALQPVGRLEELIVEKIGLTVWKQHRLAAAESARIELERDTRRACFRHQVEEAGGIVFPFKVTPDDMQELDEEELEYLEWCKAFLLEYSTLEYEEPVEDEDLLQALPHLPTINQHFLEAVADSEYSALEFSTQFEGGLLGWLEEVVGICSEELRALIRRRSISALTTLVKTANSAPIEIDALSRYQASLDSELYKAIDSLSKQQKWRMKIELHNQKEGFTEAEALD